MSGNNLFVDTNFLIYLLNARPFVTPYLGNKGELLKKAEAMRDRKSA